MEDPVKASDQISKLAAQGRYHFSTREIAQIMGVPLTAVRAALRRLKQKGLIATPYRGFHVIVAPEYRGIGCLPADQFIGQLLEHLGLAYYVALLSAARYHGAAHQQPQIFQVMVQKNRPPLECGNVRVGFVARRNIEKIPTVSFNSPRGPVRVSSPVGTAFDLVGYSAHAGGLDNATTVLAELSESINPQELESTAALSPMPWAQRLGYLFSLVGANEHADALSEHVARSSHDTVLLDPSGPKSGALRDARWKLLVNVEVEPDL
ncbi:MAG: type IV toxin-antitoxin system AbiEi family antitoxin [Candidatus Krumholzibacteria bacterium]|nr:type IV toxin-antitoxin system AbiEi family antitoxin [Candidatus Krumholzibacteria bacterium]